MYSINSIGRFFADKFIIYVHDEKLEANSLIEAVISNTKLLTNNSLEYDNLLEVFKKRLDIVYSGRNKISKVLNSNGFSKKSNLFSIRNLLNEKSYLTMTKMSMRDISSIMTSLFIYEDDKKVYNGLEVTEKNANATLVAGATFNGIINECYTLIEYYTKFNNFRVTPNDIINKDIRKNLNNDPKKLERGNYLKLFNLARMFIIASENKPDINYSKLIKEGKSPINYKIYNSCGDKVVPNDLLYAGKYGKAAREFNEIFDKLLGYKGSYECLLNLFDDAVADLHEQKKVDKDTIKKIIGIAYNYYGARYLLMKKTNAMSKDELEIYKEKFKSSVDVVCIEFGIILNPYELSTKVFDEKLIESRTYSVNSYYRLNEVKENIDVQDKISEISKKKIKKLIKQKDLN